ncbi:MAG: hypothetical protein Q4B67_03590 [Eubacteriales bacterium]|nr:hypothetical protein [Eubacteriales bacterium]
MNQLNFEAINDVGLFFYVKGRLLFHGCSLSEAEKYGNNLIYPGGHFDIWERNYYKKYHVDYDYYPRGRVVYRIKDETFVVYGDRCIDKELREFFNGYAQNNPEHRYVFEHDEHYQCHSCNRDYFF